MQIIDLKTYSVILWDTGHIKGKSFTGGIEEGKETKNLNVVDLFSLQE
jgi:hypothetical protein